MTVVYSVNGRVKPGRYDEFVATGSTVHKIFERCGARETATYVAAIAGEADGSWLFTAEFDTAEAFGAAWDRLMADEEMHAVIERAQGPDNPTPTDSQSLCVSLPTGRTARAGRGTILEVHVARPGPNPARSIGEAVRVLDFVERHGACHGQIGTLLDAGTLSGATVVSWEHPDMRSYGRIIDAFTSDPEGRQLAETNLGPDAAPELFAGLYTVLPR
jgi:hypothetical protein